MCGRHDAHVDFDLPRAADAHDAALLEHPQQRRLRLWRELAYFVQKQLPPCACSKMP
jgi:hypothetical protein